MAGGDKEAPCVSWLPACRIGYQSNSAASLVSTQHSVLREGRMGEIVAAIGTAHAPQFLTKPDTEDPRQLEEVFTALTTLKGRLREVAPDVVLIIANDHVENFYL